jgi:hypothetical protein
MARLGVQSGSVVLRGDATPGADDDDRVRVVRYQGRVVSPIYVRECGESSAISGRPGVSATCSEDERTVRVPNAPRAVIRRRYGSVRAFGRDVTSHVLGS